MDYLFTHKGSINRRSFLKMSGLLGVGLVSTSIIPCKAEAIKFSNAFYKVSNTKLAMGTTVSMTLIHPSQNEAEEAMGRAFEKIDQLTALMNRFDSRTAIGQLNQEGALKDINPEIVDVLSHSIKYFKLTNGAFDVSVKPLVDLFKETMAKGKNRYPADSDIKKILKRIGSDNIELVGNTVRFNKPGMGITLDGIAKGYIVDQAAELLSHLKIENYLINAGGDIRAKGRRRDKKPWVIAIQNPKKNGRHPEMIQLLDAAIATSGNYEVYFDREKMFHHIVNPKTGMSPYASSSVSVIAPTTMTADALSTSVFVMNPEQGTGLINSLPNCESLVLSRVNHKTKSLGWESNTI